MSYDAISADAISSDSFLTSSSLLIVDNSTQMDSLRLYNTYDSLSVAPRAFFGPTDPLQFYKGCQYAVQFTATLKKTFVGEATVAVYLTGSAFPSTADALGHLVATLESSADYQRFEDLEYVLMADNTGHAYLRFVVYGGQWNVGDLSVSYAIERGFHPDRARTIISVPSTPRRFAPVKALSKVYTGANSPVPVNLESAEFILTGSNTYIVGTDNRVEGTLKVNSNEQSFNPNYGIIISTQGYTSSFGQVVPDAPSIYIGQGHAASSSTPFFVGSGSDGVTFFVGTTNPTLSIPNWSSSVSQSYILFTNGQLQLATPYLNVVSPTVKISSLGVGSMSFGQAFGIDQGLGVWIDGAGQFRVGTDTSIANPRYIQFANGQLRVQGDVYVTDPASSDPSLFRDIKEVIASYIAFGPFGFYVSNL